MFVGREVELAWLTDRITADEASISLLSGPSGVGKTALVSTACADRPVVHLHCPPLPGPTQLQKLGSAIGKTPSEWSEFFDAALTWAAGSDGPAVLVLDDVHRLAEARQRIGPELSELIRRARKETIPLHLVLVGRGGGFPEWPERSPVELDAPRVLGPLAAHEAAPLLPGSKPSSRIRAYAVFGGHPARLRLLDRDVSVGTNLRRLVLREDGRLLRAGLDDLERCVQAPARYVAVLQALAPGEVAWSEVHGGVADLTRSGQVAPYLQRLAELGLVESSQSLDAEPGSRSRRYRIRDPFLRFWYRYVLGDVEELRGGRGAKLWAEVIRPDLPGFVEQVFVDVCRDFMRSTAGRRFGSVAREVGGLWGPGYDIPVSGMLRSGGAFHGVSVWQDAAEAKTLARLDRQIRETRYGFGRERRLRIIFTRHEPARELERQVARRENVAVVRAEELLSPPA